jgi:hypothetical protein
VFAAVNDPMPDCAYFVYILDNAVVWVKQRIHYASYSNGMVRNIGFQRKFILAFGFMHNPRTVYADTFNQSLCQRIFVRHIN